MWTQLPSSSNFSPFVEGQGRITPTITALGMAGRTLSHGPTTLPAQTSENSEKKKAEVVDGAQTLVSSGERGNHCCQLLISALTSGLQVPVLKRIKLCNDLIFINKHKDW